jgi:hypothetical protein
MNIAGWRRWIEAERFKFFEASKRKDVQFDRLKQGLASSAGVATRQSLWCIFA